MTTDESWYAVYTRPRWEKKIAAQLTEKGVINFCPLNNVLRQWHDRKKLVAEPLFTCYIFVRINLKDQLEVLQTNGVMNFVYWLGKPAVIKDVEIERIRDFVFHHQNISIEKIRLQINDKVKILSGPFVAQEGHIIALKSKSVKLYLPSLGLALCAEVERSNIEKIKTT